MKAAQEKCVSWREAGEQGEKEALRGGEVVLAQQLGTSTRAVFLPSSRIPHFLSPVSFLCFPTSKFLSASS